MTVNVRQYVKSSRVGWEVDIRFAWPDGKVFRRRYRAPVSTKSQALAWGRAREVALLTAGQGDELARSRRDEEEKEVPTLETFAPSFIRDYAEAEKQKASTVDTKDRILRLHLLPLLGKKRLDQITAEDVQKVKGALAHRSRKTVNNVINVLSKLLNVALEWGVIQQRPKTRLLKVDSPAPRFYEYDEYARLVAAAKVTEPNAHVAVLLGGDAGLRRGEILALKWSDVDLKRRKLHIQRSVWKEVEDTPKGVDPYVGPIKKVLETSKAPPSEAFYAAIAAEGLDADPSLPSFRQRVAGVLSSLERGIERVAVGHPSAPERCVDEPPRR
jgi:hypothetical protein